MTILRFLCLTLCLILTLPSAPTAQEANGTISAVTTDQDDAAIRQRISEILIELGNYEDVQVTVSEGVVTFEGTTTSAVEAAELDTLAARVEGCLLYTSDAADD